MCLYLVPEDYWFSHGFYIRAPPGFLQIFSLMRRNGIIIPETTYTFSLTGWCLNLSARHNNQISKVYCWCHIIGISCSLAK